MHVAGHVRMRACMWLAMCTLDCIECLKSTVAVCCVSRRSLTLAYTPALPHCSNAGTVCQFIALSSTTCSFVSAEGMLHGHTSDRRSIPLVALVSASWQ